MGFFSFLSGRPDRIELALPAKDRADFLVYFTAVGGTPPSEGDLVGAALAWLEERVDEPLRTRLRRAIDAAGLLIELNEVKDVDPPPREILAHLSPPGWERGLAASTHVAVVTAVADAMVPPVALLTALGAARGIALATDGGILDPALPRFEDPASFEERFTAEWTFIISEHVVLSSSVDERGRGWLTSLGLGRFALPELEVRDVPPHLDQHLVPIVNGLALALVESAWRAPVSEDGEQRHLVLEMPLRVGWRDIVASMGGSEADDGSAPAPLASPLEFALEHRTQRRSHDFLRVVRPEGVKLSQGEWLSSLLAPLAGEDAVYHPGEQSGDAMIRAHQAAIVELPRMRERFLAGLAPGEVFAVKKGFDADDGGSEFMWVVVQTWRGATLRGVLANTPQGVSDLRAGQDIELSEEEIYDWCLQLADGSMEGAFTDKVARGG